MESTELYVATDFEACFSAIFFLRRSPASVPITVAAVPTAAPTLRIIEGETGNARTHAEA